MTDFVYPLVAIRDDGETIIARSPDEAAAFNRLRPGPRHVQGFMWISGRSPAGPVWRESVTRHEWIVRDHLGAVVLHEDLPRTTAPRHDWLRRRAIEVQKAAERGLPIPGTGRSVRYSRGYRAFRKNVAMRAAEAALDDDLEAWGIPHARVGRRRVPGLPQVWDDVPWRADRRCWKDYRSAQWRPSDRKEHGMSGTQTV